jgi:glycosyltransferase involved in cell wall biosynthesis
MNVLFLTRYGRLGASSRLRSMQFLPWLEAEGLRCTVQPLFSDELLSKKYTSGSYGLGAVLGAYLARVSLMLRSRQFDLVWIEKEALPWMPAWVERLLLAGVPYVLDFDDAVFHNYDLHRAALVRRLMGRRIDRVMAGARMATCGNGYLAQRARDAGAGAVELLPTVIDLERYAPTPRAAESAEPLRIVWIGSPSTVKYLAQLAAPLAQLAQRCRFRLRVIGGSLEMPGVDLECVPWTESSEVASIAQCEIGIMPLNDSPWERGKCGYKLIQYMACGLPVVASPVGVNVEIVRDSANGFLVDGDQAWVTRLEELLGDAALRQRMGSAGRRIVEQHYSVQAVSGQMANHLRNAEKKKICVD